MYLCHFILFHFIVVVRDMAERFAGLRACVSSANLRLSLDGAAANSRHSLPCCCVIGSPLVSFHFISFSIDSILFVSLSFFCFVSHSSSFAASSCICAILFYFILLLWSGTWPNEPRRGRTICMRACVSRALLLAVGSPYCGWLFAVVMTTTTTTHCGCPCHRRLLYSSYFRTSSGLLACLWLWLRLQYSTVQYSTVQLRLDFYCCCCCCCCCWHRIVRGWPLLLLMLRLCL